mmetsp:Transcript_10927/g.24126  ORF Transcript_10927/g.24126 Transcript_10927/m.24126 type:complete len:85 (-) Transcript_10927:1265-1519(-)
MSIQQYIPILHITSLLSTNNIGMAPVHVSCILNDFFNVFPWDRDESHIINEVKGLKRFLFHQMQPRSLLDNMELIFVNRANIRV